MKKADLHIGDVYAMVQPGTPNYHYRTLLDRGIAAKPVILIGDGNYNVVRQSCGDMIVPSATGSRKLVIAQPAWTHVSPWVEAPDLDRFGKPRMVFGITPDTEWEAVFTTTNQLLMTWAEFQERHEATWDVYREQRIDFEYIRDTRHAARLERERGLHFLGLTPDEEQRTGLNRMEEDLDAQVADGFIHIRTEAFAAMLKVNNQKQLRLALKHFEMAVQHEARADERQKKMECRP